MREAARHGIEINTLQELTEYLWDYYRIRKDGPK